jgi:hypothetical protein
MWPGPISRVNQASPISRCRNSAEPEIVQDTNGSGSRAQGNDLPRSEIDNAARADCSFVSTAICYLRFRGIMFISKRPRVRIPLGLLLVEWQIARARKVRAHGLEEGVVFARLIGSLKTIRARTSRMKVVHPFANQQ